MKLGNDTNVWLLYEDFVVKLVVVTILYCAVLMLIDGSLFHSSHNVGNLMVKLDSLSSFRILMGGGFCIKNRVIQGSYF